MQLKFVTLVKGDPLPKLAWPNVEAGAWNRLAPSHPSLPACILHRAYQGCVKQETVCRQHRCSWKLKDDTNAERMSGPLSAGLQQPASDDEVIYLSENIQYVITGPAGGQAGQEAAEWTCCGRGCCSGRVIRRCRSSSAQSQRRGHRRG